MSLAKSNPLILDNVTVAASNYQETPTGIDTSSAIDLHIGFKMTFNAAATAGARIDAYGDPAGASATFTIGANAVRTDYVSITQVQNQEVEGVVKIAHGAKFTKLRVVNLDATYTITGCSLWEQKQTA